jgi:hypothetical protein
VAKLVDALALGASGAIHESSSLFLGTNYFQITNLPSKNMTYEEMLAIDDNTNFISILNNRIGNFETTFDLLKEMIAWEEKNKTISVSDSEVGSIAMIKRLFVDKSKTLEILSFMKNLDESTGSNTLQKSIIAKVAMDRIFLGKE